MKHSFPQQMQSARVHRTPLLSSAQARQVLLSGQERGEVSSETRDRGVGQRSIVIHASHDPPPSLEGRRPPTGTHVSAGTSQGVTGSALFETHFLIQLGSMKHVSYPHVFNSSFARGGSWR
jgi:hypothetical protein